MRQASLPKTLRFSGLRPAPFPYGRAKARELTLPGLRPAPRKPAASPAVGGSPLAFGERCAERRIAPSARVYKKKDGAYAPGPSACGLGGGSTHGLRPAALSKSGRNSGGRKKNHARPAAGLYGPGTGLLRKAPAFNLYTTISGRGLCCALVKIWRQANGEYGLPALLFVWARDCSRSPNPSLAHTHTALSRDSGQGHGAENIRPSQKSLASLPIFEMSYLIDS